MRADDKPEVIQDRLADYHAKTQPIIDLFRKKELVVAVDGVKPVAEIQSEIRRRLGLAAREVA
jgi:adenylate kinase